MTKDLMLYQDLEVQQEVDENMSNLTCASNEGTNNSVSSGIGISNNNYSQHQQQQQYFVSTTTTHDEPPKRKRNLPGNPDPDAEVIALSPKSLLATNRFICEICNKGFQRDQNLQLHRRGHNLPWKLKQRANKDGIIRKKVYVCPEPTCVHHDPSRALGDLTGIKKHFCRKHGEKKWKCDKCSKKYAVQSDWKAHSKTCGTREYRCDCGTLFSRRDSFITHRAFCDALAEENARSITTNNINLQTQFNPQQNNNNNQNFNLIRPELLLPPWLGPQNNPYHHHQQGQHPSLHNTLNPNPNPRFGPTIQPTPASPHMSATALLQKAAQMGATISSSSTRSSTTTAAASAPNSASASIAMIRPHHHQQQGHVTADPAGHVTTDPAGNSNNFGLNLSSHHHDHNQDKFTSTISNTTTSTSTSIGLIGGNCSSELLVQPFGSSILLQDVAMMNPPFSSASGSSGFDGITTTFEDDCNLFLHNDTSISKTSGDEGGRGGGGGGNNEKGLTRDFLGLRSFSHSDILRIAGIENCISGNQQNHQSQKAWKGLFEERHKWVLAFMKTQFWAGMSSTQRSEGMHAFMKNYLTPKSNLEQFVRQFDNCLAWKANKEREADNEDFHTIVPCATNSLIEKQFQTEYTHSKFAEVQSEFRAKANCSTREVRVDGNIRLYEVSEKFELNGGCVGHVFKVSYDVSSFHFWCDCLLFEFRGIICRHSLCVLHMNKVKEVLEKYVLSRWSKNVSRVHSRIKCSHDSTCLEPNVRRYDAMCKKFYNIAEVACNSVEFTDTINHVLDEA